MVTSTHGDPTLYMPFCESIMVYLLMFEKEPITIKVTVNELSYGLAIVIKGII